MKFIKKKNRKENKAMGVRSNPWKEHKANYQINPKG